MLADSLFNDLKMKKAKPQMNDIRATLLALKKFPNKKLVIGINEGKLTSKFMIKSIQQYLFEQKLSQDQFEVRQVKWKDRRKKWLIKSLDFYLALEHK